MTIPQNPKGDNPSDKISKWVVKQDERLNALPKAFGSIGLILEGRVYDNVEFLTADYRGGYWFFYTLSNGGFYMAPKTDALFRMVNPANYSDEKMSADAAGICACLFALSQMCFESDNPVLAERFHQLRGFAAEHSEAGKIFKLID